MVFNSELLQSTYEECKPILERQGLTLNQISEDIHNLENYLSNLEMWDFTYCLSEYPFELKLDDDASISLDLPKFPNFIPKESKFEIDSEFFTREDLEWDPSSKRIIYIQYKALNIFRKNKDEFEWYYGGEEEIVISKPIIETKVKLRKRIFSHLPDFLKHIARFHGNEVCNYYSFEKANQFVDLQNNTALSEKERAVSPGWLEFQKFKNSLVMSGQAGTILEKLEKLKTHFPEKTIFELRQMIP